MIGTACCCWREYKAFKGTEYWVVACAGSSGSTSGHGSWEEEDTGHNRSAGAAGHWEHYWTLCSIWEREQHNNVQQIRWRDLKCFCFRSSLRQKEMPTVALQAHASHSIWSPVVYQKSIVNFRKYIFYLIWFTISCDDSSSLFPWCLFISDHLELCRDSTLNTK